MADENIDWNERYANKDTPWDSGQPSKELQRVLSEYAIGPCPALEIGCGTGTNAVFLAQQGFRVTALDLSPLAIAQARQRATRAGTDINLLAADLFEPPDFGRTFEFVFDRGVYHSVRRAGLDRFLRTLASLTAPGSLYLVLAGNANETEASDKGPPRVHAHELCAELGTLFDLIQLREFRFDGVVIEGKPVQPLGWSGLLRRKGDGTAHQS
jgi:SAM-dependent methyltransferase